MPGKVYETVSTERLMEATDEKVSEEQGGFLRGKGYLNQISGIILVVEEILGKCYKTVCSLQGLRESI